MDHTSADGLQQMLKGMPEPPFGTSKVKDPLNVPKDPTQRKQKMHQLLQEAAGHWQNSGKGFQEPKADPVQMFLEDLIRRASKHFEKGKNEEGLKMLHKGVFVAGVFVMFTPTYSHLHTHTYILTPT